MNTTNLTAHNYVDRISRTAVVKRINRALERDDEIVRRPRSARALFGDYYRIDTRIGALIETHVDVEQLARDLGVVAPQESITD